MGMSNRTHIYDVFRIFRRIIFSVEFRRKSAKSLTLLTHLAWTFEADQKKNRKKISSVKSKDKEEIFLEFFFSYGGEAKKIFGTDDRQQRPVC